MKGIKVKMKAFLVFAFICANLRPMVVAFAETPTPVTDQAFDKAAEELDKAKTETQKLKQAWDKARLETTLYEQRAKRATEKFAKATKDFRDKAGAQKKKAELEFQLALEKRKLAFSQWQEAQLKMATRESFMKALDKERESNAIKLKIQGLEEKLKGSSKANGQ